MSKATLDRQAVADTVRAYIVENFFFGKPEALDDQANLMEAGAIDSTGFMELVAFVEASFPVSVQDDELTPENFAALDRIVAYVVRKSA